MAVAPTESAALFVKAFELLSFVSVNVGGLHTLQGFNPKSIAFSKVIGVPLFEICLQVHRFHRD